METEKLLIEENIAELCRLALAEDVRDGDATTLAIVPAAMETEARFVTRQDCICAGLPVVIELFRQLDETVAVECLVKDGDFCPKGTVMAVVRGSARAILTGERTALNFLQRLCGVATVTRRYVEALGESKTVLLDTRKTTPGYRLLEKYAVKMGGAQNHRIGLYDRIMIKDNHRALASLSGPDSIRRAVESCRREYPELEIEVEADSMDDFRAAWECGVEYILLDNMSNEMMSEAIKINQGRCKLEASGNITLERLPSLRNLGLDFISSGALTHSAPSIDIGLDIDC